MTDCIFCKIVAGEIPADKVYEDEDFLAFLDIHPINLGHTLLIPKKHYENLFDLPSDLLEKIGPKIQLIARAVLVGAGADALNLGMNNGASAGQLVGHAHLHLIPRFDDDGLQHWSAKEFSAEIFKETAEKIKKGL